MAKTLYVNPTAGNDNAVGNLQAPLKTITQALKQATTGSQIQLTDGYYTTATGEVFPITVTNGVTIVGNEGNKGSSILIEGSGEYRSRTLAKQIVTFILSNDVEMRGVSVTNSSHRGVAIWIESATSTIANCTFFNCKREGIFATGNANVIIINNVLAENSSNGISIVRDTQGEIRGNICSGGDVGIAIGDRAFVQLTDNRIYENRCGIIISGDAHPVLRNNISERNTEDGLTVTSNALPDLGNSNDYGGNILRLNGKFDLHNASSNRLLAVGNQIEPGKIKGYVELVYNQFPTQTIKLPQTKSTPPVPLTPTSTPPLTPTLTPSLRELTDIKDHWAAEFIQELFKLEIVTGFRDRTFKPDATITRAHFAAMLVKAFNPSVKRQAIEFKDVPESFWAYKAIQRAYEGQFLSAYPNNSFHPNQNIQRVQVIVSLVNGLGLGVDSITDLNLYNDQETIPDNAKKEVVIATQKRLVVNFPDRDRLNPTRDATRAEVAVMVYQALVNAGQVAAIDSSYIV